MEGKKDSSERCRLRGGERERVGEGGKEGGWGEESEIREAAAVVPQCSTGAVKIKCRIDEEREADNQDSNYSTLTLLLVFILVPAVRTVVNCSQTAAQVRLPSFFKY